MPTNSQILRNPRIKRKKKSNVVFLKNKPFMKGVCKKILKNRPKKPNSAQRTIAKAILNTGKVLTVYIPGEGNSLQEHSTILIRGGKTPDLPAVSYKAVRGKYDLGGVEKRCKSRSIYGTKKPK